MFHLNDPIDVMQDAVVYCGLIDQVAVVSLAWRINPELFYKARPLQTRFEIVSCWLLNDVK